MKTCQAAALVLGLLFADAAVAQQSRSPFDAPTVQHFSVPFRRLADLDLDGDMDAVGVLLQRPAGRYLFAAYRNNQGVFEGGFQETPSLDRGTTLHVEVGHLNADTWPDVCILWGARREDWLGTGNGFFAATSTPLAEVAQAMALADVDGDGIDDLAWMGADALYLQTSSGPADSIAAPGTKHTLRVLAHDGPFGSDVFVAHVGNDIRIFYGHRATGLVTGPSFATGVPMGMVDTGDIDGDGDIDAVVFGMHSYRVLRRLSRQNWSLEAEVSGGPAQFLRDVDGDGDLDGVCCSGGGGNGDHYEFPTFASRFEISINDGSGSFAPAFEIPSIGAEELAGVADVDLDGDLDLVAGLCVYYADGVVRPLRSSAVIPPCRSRRALSDCDGDGDVDVGFSAQAVYANDGAGGFTLEPTGAVAPEGGVFRGPGYPGDFDGDGDVDLVVQVAPLLRDRAQGQLGAGPGPLDSMALLRNTGSGLLARPTPAAARGLTFGIDSVDPELSLLADIDRDGDLDLLTRSATTFGADETRAFANDGVGYFLPAGRLAQLRALWAGDLDQDGDLDLVAAGAGYEGTSTYPLLGSQTQPGRLPVMTWSGVYWNQESASPIEEADFDADGRLDFAVVSQDWNRGVVPPTLMDSFPSLLLNRFGLGGTLQANTGLDVPSNDPDYPRGLRVSLGDVQGDGRMDALVGPLALEGVSLCKVVTRRAGAGLSFVRTLQLVPAGILIDLDGDGALDILGERIVFHR